ncbi:hypothetical protein ACLQ2O_33955 [Kribbella sp. DT2]
MAEIATRVCAAPLFADSAMTRELETSLRLHLPRFADESGYVDLGPALAEAHRLHSLLGTRSPERFTEVPQEQRLRPVRELSLQPIPERWGRLISENLHYLGVARSDAEHWALRSPESGAVHCYGCVSQVGFEGKRQAIDQVLGSPMTRIVSLSRVYAFPSRPRNAISYLIARLLRTSRMAREADWVITTVDPNLGFSGSSYTSAGWKVLHQYTSQRYDYLDANFVTPGQLARRFGTTDRSVLSKQLGRRFETSRCTLDGQLVFGISRKERRGS